MGLGKINKLIQGYVEKIQPRDNTIVNKDAVNSEIKKYYSELGADTTPLPEKTTVDDLIKNAKKAHNDIVSKREKPSMGLENPNIKKAENDLKRTEQTTQNNIQNAESNLTQTTTDVKSNNQNAQNIVAENTETANTNNTQAEEAVSTAQSTAEANNADAQEEVQNTQTEATENNTQAEENLDTVKDDAQTKKNDAQTQVDSAREAQSSAQNAVESAQQSVNNAQTTLSNAQTALSQAKTDEEKQSLQQQVNSAQQALETAQKALEEKQMALNEANAALEEAKSNLEQVISDGETAVQEAEQNVSDVKQAGTEAVNTAQQNQEKVKATGTENIQSAEQNANDVKKAGEKAVQDAKQSATQIKAQGEQSIQNAENDIKVAETEGDKKVENAQNTVEVQQDKAQQEIPKPEEIAQTIIDMAKGVDKDGNKVKYDKNLYNEAMSQINEENIVEVLKAGGKDFADAITGNKIENKKIIKRAEEDSKKIIDCMNKYYEANYKNYEHPTLGKLEELEEKVYNVSSTMEFANELTSSNPKNAAYIMAVNGIEDITKLEDEINYINSRYLDVNGEIDEKSTQQTGNCWAHAAINSLASIPQGQEIIQNNITRNSETGITEVTLPGAGKTYQITDKELYEATYSISYGDPDMTAYNIAIDKYLQENPEGRFNIFNKTYEKVNSSGQGNTPQLAYHLLCNENTDFNYESSRETQIPTGSNAYFVNGNETDKQYYNELYELVKNGNTVATLSYGGHAWAVIGIDEQKRLLVTESNNSRDIANYLVGENNVETREDINGYTQYTMHLDFETFTKKIRSCTTHRF